MAKAEDQRDQPKPSSQSPKDASHHAPDIYTNCTRAYTWELYRELCSFPVHQSRPSPFSPSSWPSAYCTEQNSDNKARLYESKLIQPNSLVDVPTNCVSCRFGGGHGAPTSSPTAILTEFKWRVRSHSPELKRRKTGCSLMGDHIPLSPNHSLAGRNGLVSGAIELESLIGICTKLSDLNIRNEFEGQGPSSPANTHFSSSSSDISRQDHDSQGTEGWGKALDRTGLDAACDPTECNATSSDRASNRGRGMSPTTSSKAKVVERRSGSSSPQLNLSDLHEKTVSEWCNPTPSNVDDLRSRSPSLSQWCQTAQESESDGSGTKSSRVQNSRSRSISPWSQAARDINKNNSSKDTGDWGKNLTQIGPDAWSQPRFNISHDAASRKRSRGGWGLRDQSLSPEPKRRTGQDLDRTRGRYDNYLPHNNNRQRRYGLFRGSGCTNSPKRHQNRSFKRSSGMASARTNEREDDKENLPRSSNLWNQTDRYAGNQFLSRLSRCHCLNRKRGDPSPEHKGRTERDPHCSRDRARHRIYSCNNMVELDQWRSRKRSSNPSKAQVALLCSPMILECAPLLPNSTECSALVGPILAVPLSLLSPPTLNPMLGNQLQQQGANSPKLSTIVLAATLPVPNTVPADAILAEKQALAGAKRTREGLRKRE